MRPPEHVRPPLLPRWWTCSPGRSISTTSQLSRFTPWGTTHARELGSNRTACGEVAISWHLFFDRPVDPRNPNTCEEFGVEVSRRAKHKQSGR